VHADDAGHALEAAFAANDRVVAAAVGLDAVDDLRGERVLGEEAAADR
jgi:hypothetical protein